MLKLWLLLLILVFNPSSSITPPRIIYGGWTPILPGHPFYFGSVGSRGLTHYQHAHEHYTEHAPESNGHYPEQPEVVHEVEHHVELVNPEQYRNYGNQQQQGVYRKPQLSIHPLTQVSGKDEQIVYSHRPQKDIFSYYPPYSAYEAPKKQEFQYKPLYFEIPRKPSSNYNRARQHLTSLPVNLKDLKPLHPVDENAVLKYANALKHIGQLNAGQIQYLAPGVFPKHAKYPVIKDSSGGIPKRPSSLAYVDTLKQIGHINADKIQYLIPEVFPKHGKYPTIKDSSGGIGKRPAALSTPRYNIPITIPRHVQANLAHVPYDIIHQSKSFNSDNTYKGSIFDVDGHHSAKRPLNPIETKQIRNSHLQLSKLPEINTGIHSLPKINSYNNNQLHSHRPFLSEPILGPHIYPTNHGLRSNVKYLQPIQTSNVHLGLDKNLLSPANQNIAHKINSYLTHKTPHYTPIQPLHTVTRPVYPATGYHPYAAHKNSVHLPIRTLPTPLAPKLLPHYLHKDVKLHTLYKNPSVVTNIRGAPAIVEREVAIIHVPVADHHSQDYSGEKDYLYDTASTPESTQILDIGHLNESHGYGNLDKRLPDIKDHEAYTHITLDFGKGQGLEHVTFVEPATDSQIQPPPRNVHKDREYESPYQYIFVSSNGVRGSNADHQQNGHSGEGHELHSSDESEAKKQFFHAYYGPPDHVPPPGYVKMTISEFNNLFQNAEIRYVDKEPQKISQQQNTEHNS